MYKKNEDRGKNEGNNTKRKWVRYAKWGENNLHFDGRKNIFRWGGGGVFGPKLAPQ
jgi:hypothetical protein